MMHKNNKFTFICVLTVLFIISVFGCKSSGGTTNGSEVGGINSTTEQQTSENTRYNSTDLAIVLNIDTAKNEITLKSIESDKNYTLSYSGGTRIKSKNDVELTMNQVETGQIVDVYYVQGSQKLIEMKESVTAWENDSVVKWRVDYDKKKITIGSTTYRYEDDIFISSKGQSISIEEVSEVDELIVRGINSQIYSVFVKKGHGFVRLVDDTNMIGGIIEIGGKIMTAITEDMVIVSPEGTYTLTATKNGTGGSKEITVIRDEELIVSLSEFQEEATRYGSIKFNISPEDSEAIMYINGEEKDYSDLVELPYGNHMLVLKSNNYDTFQKAITITSIYTTINIDMSSGEEETSTVSEEPATEVEEETTANDEEETTISQGTGTYNNQVCIATPTNVTVYIDGVSKGSTPVIFEKTPGTHTVLLMKDGYKSKVYTIYLNDTREDMVFSYPDMVKSDE
ncbi:MAG: PEGA domain-containing protein [Lachnospiraceae bacterium]|nr:PEGA domain-containing protein [Lachnospiraceae bacterium]